MRQPPSSVLVHGTEGRVVMDGPSLIVGCLEAVSLGPCQFGGRKPSQNSAPARSVWALNRGAQGHATVSPDRTNGVCLPHRAVVLGPGSSCMSPVTLRVGRWASGWPGEPNRGPSAGLHQGTGLLHGLGCVFSLVPHGRRVSTARYPYP